MRSLFVALAIMLSVGCGGKASSDGTTATVSSKIGVAGGTLTAADGHGTITIPPGALAGDTEITIVGVSAPTIPGANVIGPAYRFGPAGLKLSAPVTIAIPFGSGQIGMEFYLRSLRPVDLVWDRARRALRR